MKMKAMYLLLCGLALAATLPAQAVPAAGTDTKITSTWVPVDNGDPTCNTTTVTKACVWGRVLTITPPIGVTGGNTVIPSCSATVTTGCLGPVSTYVWAPGGNLYCGNWGVAVATVYSDATGAVQTTASISTTTNEPCPFVPPGKPSAISASPGL